METIKVDNVWGKLITPDTALMDFLTSKLRYRPKGYFHSVAYQKKRWDGWKYLISPKTGRFLAGLLPEIEFALQKLNRTYVLEDSRQKYTWLYDKIDANFLNSVLPPGVTFPEMYDYQADLVNQCLKHGRGIVQAPTSAGKTAILISLLKCIKPKTPVLFFTKSAALVHQNYEDMKLYGVENLGRWYEGFKEPNFVMCAVSHIETFRSIEKLLPKFKVLIVDEVHDCMSDVPMAAYQKMTSCSARFGISATAFRSDKKKVDADHKWNVKGHFGPIIKTTTTETGYLTTKGLQERNILAKSKCYFYKIKEPNLKHETYQQAVHLGIEQNFDFHRMVRNLANTCQGRTLIVVDRIEHGNYLENMIEGSTFIQGKSKFSEREEVLNSLKTGGRSVGIIMKQIITAGINAKIHDLINAAGGDAAHNIIQLMGRGLRKADDKDGLRYHDFFFENNDYLHSHSKWRVEVLSKEGHDIEIIDEFPY